MQCSEFLNQYNLHDSLLETVTVSGIVYKVWSMAIYHWLFLLSGASSGSLQFQDPDSLPHGFVQIHDSSPVQIYTGCRHSKDTWKYVVKYHVTLTQEFIDHVMSGDGKAYLNQFAKENNFCANLIEDLKNRPNTICLLPDDAGEIPLANFWVLTMYLTVQMSYLRI